MSWKFKGLEPFIPTVSSTMLSDLAVAQTTSPSPPPPPPSIDPVTAGGYFLAVVVSITAIAPEIAKRWFNAAIANKQSQDDLKTQITKTQAELELLEKKKELEAANNLSDFYLQSAKDLQKTQTDLLLRSVTETANRYQQLLDTFHEQSAIIKKMSDRIEKLTEELALMDKLQHDILNVLKMKERSGTGN